MWDEQILNNKIKIGGKIGKRNILFSLLPNFFCFFLFFFGVGSLDEIWSFEKSWLENCEDKYNSYVPNNVTY